MSPRFLITVTGLLLAFFLASTLALVLAYPAPGGFVTFAGLQGTGFVVLLRAALLAAVPQTNPEQAVASSRLRRRWTTAGLLVGGLATVVGLVLVLDPLVAGVACVASTGGLVLLVRALDRYAARIAERHPVDTVRPGDDDRLGPAAVRAELQRRATQGLLAGALTGAVVAPLVASFGSGALAGAFAGIVALIAVWVAVLGFGSIGLTWAAGRRLSALVSEDPSRVKRLRKAVLRRRTADLDEIDRRQAHRWAQLAEPAFLLQFVGQLPVLVWVPGLQAAQLLSDPGDVFRRWLVGGMLAIMLPVYALMVVQWRRVRAVVRDDFSTTSGV